jgi:hypothetical protein
MPQVIVAPEEQRRFASVLDAEIDALQQKRRTTMPAPRPLSHRFTAVRQITSRLLHLTPDTSTSARDQLRSLGYGRQF